MGASEFFQVTRHNFSYDIRGRYHNLESLESHFVRVKKDFVVLQQKINCYEMKWLTKLGFGGSFCRIEKRPLKIKERGISVCNFKDKYIYASGGNGNFYTFSNKVHVYELKTEKWFRGLL